MHHHRALGGLTITITTLAPHAPCAQHSRLPDASPRPVHPLTLSRKRTLSFSCNCASCFLILNCRLRWHRHTRAKVRSGSSKWTDGAAVRCATHCLPSPSAPRLVRLTAYEASMPRVSSPDHSAHVLRARVLCYAPRKPAGLVGWSVIAARLDESSAGCGHHAHSLSVRSVPSSDGLRGGGELSPYTRARVCTPRGPEAGVLGAH